MGVIKVQRFNPFTKTALRDAMDQAMNDDIIELNKEHTLLRKYKVQAGRILTIEGVHKNCKLQVIPNEIAFELEGNAQLRLKNMNIKISEFSSFIKAENFTGHVYLDNVTISFEHGYPNDGGAVFLINDKCQQNTGSILFNDCDFYVENSVIFSDEITIENTKFDDVTTLYNLKPTNKCFLVANKMNVNDSTLSGVRLFARNTGQFTLLKSNGELGLYGIWKGESLKFISMKEITEGRTTAWIEKRGERINNTLLIVGKYRNDVVSHTTIKNIIVANELVKAQEWVDYQFIKVNADLTLQHANIPKLNQDNYLKQGTLTLENVTDASVWNIDEDEKNAVVLQKTKAPSLLEIINKTRPIPLKMEDVATSEEPIQAKMDALAEIEMLTGLRSVKNRIKELIALAQLNKERERRGMRANKSGTSMHMVFAGVAGTGKTTVARLFGKALYERGILPTDKFVEATRKDLVGEYIGQTAPKTSKLVESARGGVLFIDEAYALKSQGERDFSSEAVAQLIADMETYRDDLVVILAGYTEDMRDFIQNENDGLRSRFSTWVEFPSYNKAELGEILELTLTTDGLIPAAVEDLAFAKEQVGELYVEVEEKYGANAVGNARFVRNFAQRIAFVKDTRLAITGGIEYLDNDELLTYIKADIIKTVEDLRTMQNQMG